MIKYDIGFSIGDFVQIRSYRGNVLSIITNIEADYRKGLIISILVLDTLELPKEFLYSNFVILFGDAHVTKINKKDLIEQLKVKYNLYLLNNS